MSSWNQKLINPKRWTLKWTCAFTLSLLILPNSYSYLGLESNPPGSRKSTKSWCADVCSVTIILFIIIANIRVGENSLTNNITKQCLRELWKGMLQRSPSVFCVSTIWGCNGPFFREAYSFLISTLRHHILSSIAVVLNGSHAETRRSIWDWFVTTVLEAYLHQHQQRFYSAIHTCCEFMESGVYTIFKSIN